MECISYKQRNNGFLCFEGSYDYYLEKRDALMKLHEEKQVAVSGVSASVSSDDAASSKGSKEDWANAKKKQAETRKIENELKKCEEEINRLEARNSEIDEEMQQPDVATRPSMLMELSAEHEKNSKELEALLEKWEELSEKLDS